MLTFDDQFLLTVAEDGCLFTWRVFDKDGRGIKREREVGFAEEVLVTKTDMEEKVRPRPKRGGAQNPLADYTQGAQASISGPLKACLAVPTGCCSQLAPCQQASLLATTLLLPSSHSLSFGAMTTLTDTVFESHDPAFFRLQCKSGNHGKGL